MNRRWFVRTAGTVAAGITGLAGCGSSVPSPDDGGGSEPIGGGTTVGTETEAGAETATEVETGTGTTGTVEGYTLGGRVEAWVGREPRSIASQENPTLELEAGTEYEITWENLDGQLHDLTIQDADRDTLESTGRTSEKGATLTLSFTATEEMSRYICTVHPATMVGDIEPGG